MNLRLDFTKLNIIRQNINDRRTLEEIMKESIKASGKRDLIQNKVEIIIKCLLVVYFQLKIKLIF